MRGRENPCPRLDSINKCIRGWRAATCCALAGLALVVGACTPAAEDRNAAEDLRSELDACLDERDSRAAIAACTMILETGQGGTGFQNLVQVTRAVHAYDLGQFYLTIEDCTAVIRRGGSFVDRAEDYRIEAYKEVGQYGRAIESLERLLAVYPGDLTLMNHLAWVLATVPSPEHQDGPRAVELSLEVIQLDPDWVTIDTLAAAYARAGEFEKAAHEQRRAILDLRNAPPDPRERFMGVFHQEP